MSSPRPGDLLAGRYTKWGGRRHHGASLVYLGADQHGHWLADPAGKHWSGGPAEFTSKADNILLVPVERGFTAMFYDAHPVVPFAIYVDIATIPELTATTVTAVDLDLDVILERDGRLFIDDEDEFAENQVAYGYPADVIAAAEAECHQVYDEIRSGAAHFDPELAAIWRERFRSRR